MITYVPFLKAKRGEINAVGELAPGVRESICPFFDYPRKPGLDGATFVGGVKRVARSLEKHLGLDNELYFDNYDIDDTLRIGAKHNYQFLLESLAAFPVIPVVSVDRSPAHVAAVIQLKAAGQIRSDIIAFRVTPEDFEEYSVVEGDIETDLDHVFAAFDAVDLIFDCRLCAGRDPSSTAARIKNFSTNFCSTHEVRRVVITCSSIPASAREILATETERVIPRRELEIYRATNAIHDDTDLTFGDYTTVSPLYSDVNLAPEFLHNVMTAKLTYTLDDSHFFIRGAGLKANGPGQYVTMAQRLCSRAFFRGAAFSAGDRYFDQKSRGLGGNCAPNTVIKPAVNAHITYMVLSGIL